MRDYTHFSMVDRRRLYTFLSMKLSVSEIAQKLGKHRSAVYREIKRNTEEGIYLPGVAHKKTKKRRQQNRFCKLEVNQTLQKKIIDQLKRGWSPEQITGRMKLKNETESVCHETIYRFIYKQKNKELFYCLHYKKPRREKRFKRKSQRCRFGDKRLITKRPEAVNTREKIGHWEGDGIEFGASRKTNITTLVERKSRLLCLIKNEDKKSGVVMKKIRVRFDKMPKKLWSSITFDQGSEFADYRQVERKTRCTVYYCEARSPWQKGGNENMNGRLRRYLPRSTVLSTVTQDDLDLLAKQMNNQPRKCLGFQTPLEVLSQHCKIDCRTWT